MAKVFRKLVSEACHRSHSPAGCDVPGDRARARARSGATCPTTCSSRVTRSTRRPMRTASSRPSSIASAAGETFIEIGSGNGTENNTHALLLKGWRGVWVDGRADRIAFVRSEVGTSPDLFAEQAFVTRENVRNSWARWLERLGTREIDFFSLDIDGNDLPVLSAALGVFRPRVICVEYNAKFPPPLEVCDRIRSRPRLERRRLSRCVPGGVRIRPRTAGLYARDLQHLGGERFLRRRPVRCAVHPVRTGPAVPAIPLSPLQPSRADTLPSLRFLRNALRKRQR